MGEQASLEFELTFGDVLLYKLVQAYSFNLKLLKFKIWKKSQRFAPHF